MSQAFTQTDEQLQTDLVCAFMNSTRQAVTRRLMAAEFRSSHLTRRQQSLCPLLHIRNSDIVSGADDGTLVNATIQFDDDLACPPVVHELEIADVAYTRRYKIPTSAWRWERT